MMKMKFYSTATRKLTVSISNKSNVLNQLYEIIRLAEIRHSVINTVVHKNALTQTHVGWYKSEQMTGVRKYG